MDAHATCVLFGAAVGEDPESAILVSRILRKTGWGQGEPGEYAYWWLRHSEVDQHGINYYRLDDPATPEDGGYEFFPRGRGPSCEYLELAEPPVDVGLGDLGIQR